MTGVYVFDTWLRHVRTSFKEAKIPVLLQYHDEIMGICKKEYKQAVETLIYEAIDKTNKELQLNVEISVSVDWGVSYAEVH